MTLRLALVGCGGMGRRHIRGMGRLHAVGQLNFELVAVVDPFTDNAKLAQDLAAELLGTRPPIYADVASAIAAEKLDAIIVTTTPEMHIAVAQAAFDAGLHVMVEKPITLTVSEGLKLVAAGKAAHRKLAVAENYRRDPINRLGKALLDAGLIGKPFMASQASSGAGEFVIITPWRHRKGRGGIVVDMGVHYADILEFYLGPLATTFAMSAIVDPERIDKDGNRHPADAEDLSIGVAKMENGALVNWFLSMAGRGEGYFFRAIYGTGGSLVIPGDRTGQQLRLNMRKNGTDTPIPDDELLALVPDFKLDPVTAALFGGERITHYELQWADIDANLLGIEQADFVDAILNDREPEVTGEQGLRSLAVMFAFHDSELIGRPVAVDEVLRGETAVYEGQVIEGQAQ